MVWVILFRLDSIIRLDPSLVLYNYLWNGWNQVDIGPIYLIRGSNETKTQYCSAIPYEDNDNHPEPVVGLGSESTKGLVTLLDKWLEANNCHDNGHN